MLTRYRIYLNHEVQGPYNLDELVKLENLSKETLVCEDGDLEWESVGSCRSIQRQLAMQPLKWGAIQQIVLDISTIPPANYGLMRTVSTSGDFAQSERQKGRAVVRPQSKPAPTPKNSLLSRIIAFFNS